MQVELFDFDATKITQRLKGMRLNCNAFMLCTEGTVEILLDNRIYALQQGDLFLYPAFSQFAVTSYSDSLKGVLGAADFELVLKALEATGQTSRLTQIRVRPQISLSEQQFERIMRMVAIINKRREE
ncbi:MAG: hypothetical protein K2F77_08990, partial [Muribaculaceae bacterium]|nr:hypothetical protein [Muribaculaceae bacterium]